MILNCLKRFKFVSQIEVQEFRTFKDGFFVKVKAALSCGWFLFVREYVDFCERNYSYHLQDAEGNLIARWDNAPHHPNVSTYPHHKHLRGEVLPSYSITCEEILEEIAGLIDRS